jgi:hypothetical protein
MSRTLKVQTHRDRKKARQVKSKVRNILIIFFDTMGIVHKEFVLVGQTPIPHTTVTFYGDCVKICEELDPNFDDKRTGCFNTTHRLTLPFSLGNLWPKTTWLLSPIHPTCLIWPRSTSLFRAILTQLRWSRQNRRRCWTLSHNMTSRMHFKNDRSAGNSAYARKGTASRVMGASIPKVSFWPDGSTSPGNYGFFLWLEFCIVIYHMRMLPNTLKMKRRRKSQKTQ